MRNIFSSALVTVLLAGCGVNFEEPTANPKTPNGTTSQTSGVPLAARTITIKGAVVGSFEVEVNGQRFSDMEDFYTQQLDTIATQAAADYPDYRSVRLIGEIGLSDLARNLDIYVAADDKVGFATTTHSDTAGTFTVSFPASVVGAKYNIRAVKRLNVQLITADNKTVIWCWNFNGEESTTLDEPENPVLIRNFSTSLTKYKCEADSSGMSIPAPTKADQSAPTTPAPATSTANPTPTSPPVATSNDAAKYVYVN